MGSLTLHGTVVGISTITTTIITHTATTWVIQLEPCTVVGATLVVLVLLKGPDLTAPQMAASVCAVQPRPPEVTISSWKRRRGGHRGRGRVGALMPTIKMVAHSARLIASPASCTWNALKKLGVHGGGKTRGGRGTLSIILRVRGAWGRAWELIYFIPKGICVCILLFLGLQFEWESFASTCGHDWADKV